MTALFSELNSSLSVSVGDFSRGLSRASSQARGFGSTVSNAVERAGDEMSGLAGRASIASRGVSTLGDSMRNATLPARMLAGQMERVGDQISGAGARAMAAAPSFGVLAASAGGAELAISGLSMVTTASLIPAMALLSTAMLPLLGVFGAIAAGAAALGIAFGTIIGTGAIAAQQTGALSSALKQARKEITTLVTQFGKQFIPLLRDAIIALPTLVKNMLQAVGGTDQFVRTLRRLGKIAMRVLPMIVGFIFRLARTALPIFNRLITYLQKNGPTAFNRLRKAVVKLWPKVIKLVQAIVPLLPPLLKLGTTVASVLLPVLTKLAKGLTKLITWFNQLSPPIKRAVVVLSGILAVLTPIITAIASFALAVWPLISALGTLLPVLGTISTTIALLSNPITILIGLIGTLAAAWLTDWMGIRTTTMNILGQIATYIRKKWTQIKKQTGKKLRQTRRVARNVWQGINNTISKKIQGAKKSVRNGWRSIKNSTTNTLRNVQTIVRNVWQGINNTIGRSIQQTKNTARDGWNFIRNTAANVFGRVQTIARNIWQGINNTISRNIQNARSTVGSVLRRIVTTVSSWSLPRAIRSVVNRGVAAVQNFASNFYNAGRSLINSIVSGIRSAAGAVQNAVADAVGGARQFLPFSPAKKGPLSDLDKTGPAFVATMATGIRKNTGQLQQASQQAAQAAQPSPTQQPGRRRRQSTPTADALAQAINGSELRLAADTGDETLNQVVELLFSELKGELRTDESRGMRRNVSDTTSI